MSVVRSSNRRTPDGLYRAIIGAAVVLAALLAVILLTGGPGPVVAVLPWFVPVISLFQSLVLVSVAFLALGRYDVMRDPASFWIGLGSVGFGIAHIFYALSWPDLLPGGRSLIASLPGTTAYFVQFGITIFSTFLLAAVLSPWPAGRDLADRNFLWPATLWIALLILGFALTVTLEGSLPTLVGPGGLFTVPLILWNAIVALLFAAGAGLSVRRYRQTGDMLLGYTAFAQTLLAFAILATIGGMRRYDLLWYLVRVILTGGGLIILFGLLAEYVHLLRRESARIGEVLRAEEEKLEFYRRTITAATNGKLILSDRQAVCALTGPPVAEWDIRGREDIRTVRDVVTDAARSAGMEEYRRNKFVVSVIEASANAIKHAGGGRASLHRVDDGFMYVMADRGPGIPALTLPDVALRERFSTAGTLGMGYKIMITMADRVYLATGPDGTTVGIQMGIRPPEPDLG